MSKSGSLKFLSHILKMLNRDIIDLPSTPELGDAEARASAIMSELEADLGDAAHSDYFRCSRERFTYLTALAIRYLGHGAHVLDVGNAPGYLAMALHKGGFNVDGINLSDDWNSTYPDPIWLERFNVKSLDVEKQSLPYKDDSLDAIVFTEVLEHIAITDPAKIITEFRRILRIGGLVIFSTPNVCNISNILALATGKNVFWAPEIFYGSTDRHNREYTPDEVRSLFTNNGFNVKNMFGMNDHANWRNGTAEEIYEFLESKPGPHALLRNTIMAVFSVDK